MSFDNVYLTILLFTKVKKCVILYKNKKVFLNSEPLFGSASEEKTLKSDNRPTIFSRIGDFFVSVWKKISTFAKDLYSKIRARFWRAKVNAKIRKETSDKELLKSKNPDVVLWKEDPEKYRKKRTGWSRFGISVGNIVAIFVLTFVAMIVLMCGIAATVIYAYTDPSLDDKFANLEMDYTTVVYAKSLDSADYVEYQSLYNEQNRIWTSIDDMPDYLLKALISIEDKRFYDHNGVDFITTFRATAKYLLYKVTGRSTSNLAGGSTLTQQLIKVITEDNEKSSMRKVKEILRALYIERKYSKEQIIEYYLNAAYFGNGCNGIYAAAKYYFGKDVKDLTVTECAAIVSITKSPSYIEPYKNPDANKTRRNNVLYEMYTQGYLSEEEFNTFTKEELNLRDRSVKSTVSSVMSWYSDIVFNEAKNIIKEELGYTEEEAVSYIYSGGLRIYTPCIVEYQTIMEDYFENENNYPKVSNGDILPQVAMQLMDPSSGDVLAVVGGRGKKTENRVLSRVTQTRRQPGSSIKPLSVYGYAVENDIITEGSAIDDSPLRINENNGKYTPWPVNYDRVYNGVMDIKSALSHSYNTPPAKLLKEIGIDVSYDFMKTMLGIKNLVEADKIDYAPLSVGAVTNGFTMREMVSAYTVFANKGVYSDSRYVTKIETHDGKILYDGSVDKRIVFSPQTAYIITDILKNLVGSSAQAKMGNIQVAGKSGTTTSFVDRWFIGYTNEYLAGIWWGYDQPAELQNAGHVKMWKEVMTQIYKAADISSSSFSEPDGIVTATYCACSGKLAGPYCSSDPYGNQVRTGKFKAGTEPTETCDVHHQLYVCTASGQIAHENCPSAKLVTFRDVTRYFKGTYVKVKDAEYVCPPLSSYQILYKDNTLPVYTYTIPEGYLPALSTKSKSKYANTLCSTHTSSASPHYYTYKFTDEYKNGAAEE